MAYNHKVTLDRLIEKGITDPEEQKVFFLLADSEKVKIVSTSLAKKNGLTETNLAVVKNDEFRMLKKGEKLVYGRIRK